MRFSSFLAHAASILIVIFIAHSSNALLDDLDLDVDEDELALLIQRGRSKRSANPENETETETSASDNTTTTPAPKKRIIAKEQEISGTTMQAETPEYKRWREELAKRVVTVESRLPVLPEHYNKYEVPRLVVDMNQALVEVPVPMEVLISLRSILDIDEEDERILLDMDYIINWLDAKILNLQYISRVDNPEFVSVPQIFLDKIWMPDIYLDNLIELKKLRFMEAPISAALDPLAGVVQYRQRLVPNVKCGMDFHYYPADTQICQISLRSYSYGVEDIKIVWAKPVGVVLQDLMDANFDLRVDDLEHAIVPEEVHHKSNKTYYELRFKLFAKRKLSYHLLQTYIPSMFFVVITWLCFLLPSAMVEARIGITMTTLLTLTAMFASVRESTPIVSYVKAIDIWMSVCILFIFLTLFEFSMMVWMNYYREQRDSNRKSALEMRNTDGASPLAKSKAHKLEKKDSVMTISSARLRRLEATAVQMERFALPIYSISFLCFTVGYWIWLLQAADYLNWEVNPKYNKIE